MPSKSKALIICMRCPEPGSVKSRLAAAVGPAGAAVIYERLLRRTLGVAAGFKAAHPGLRVFLFYTPAEKLDLIRKKFGGPWTFWPQAPGHIGAVMDDAVRRVAQMGFEHIVLTGSDLPDLDEPDIKKAFELLESGFAVLGPAADGGFYLVGLDRPCAAPFQFDEWGTAGIFARTEQALRNSGFEVRRIGLCRDIDRPEDLAVLREKPEFSASLSIIVPTLSGPEKLAGFLESLENQLWPDDEILVIRDGARIEPVRYIRPSVLYARCERGRGIQQNLGAALAGGDILLFLHDDCTPPPGFAWSVRRACADPRMSLGCFELSFSPSTRALDLIAKWANLRTRIFKLPYGDQGFFCRTRIFERAGGFKNLYLMEDVEFARRCRKLGRITMLPRRIETSPQRYLGKGVLKASLQNHLALLLYQLGAGDRRLYSFYYGAPPARAKSAGV